MEALTQWIIEHPVATTWVTLITLIGFGITVISFVLQVKAKSKKVLYYTITTSVLVDNDVSKIDGIKVLFNDREVRNIAISNLRIWNGGNEIIEEVDFYPEYKLGFSVSNEEKILAASIEHETDATCKTRIEAYDEGDKLGIGFYCFEPRQGVNISIYHTNVDEDKIKITGKIKGGKIINKSMEVSLQKGEISISTAKHKIYFDGGVFASFIMISNAIQNVIGISIVKKKA